jgi:AsmA protein
MKFALRGGSLAELFDLLGIALPETRAYSLSGNVTHSADWWRYDKFSGQIGQSDVAGSLRVTYGAARPLLEGDLASKSLNLADLGPVVGDQAASPARQSSLRGRLVTERKADADSRALPALPFRRDRWTTIDADVQLTAQTILRPKALPLDHLTTRLRMRESVLTLDPLDFSAAGGHLVGVIRLDGQQNPIQAHAKMKVRNLLLGKLLPTIALAQNSVGQINGEIELVGRGDSIARMLATADGKVGLVIEGGKISRLLMEQVTLHVPEMVLLQITGDQLIDIRCGVADFNVEHGVMNVGTLVLDTDVTRIAGTGSVDLANETLSLTLVPRSKQFSLLALRGPIYVRGDLAHPDLSVDAGRVAMRGLAAVALGAVNPALALVALVDPGSGKNSACNALDKQT